MKHKIIEPVLNSPFIDAFLMITKKDIVKQVRVCCLVVFALAFATMHVSAQDTDNDGVDDIVDIDDDNDGILDIDEVTIIFGHIRSANSITTHSGNANGTFNTTEVETIFSQDAGIGGNENTLMADMNNDGVGDIVLANSATNEIRVILGNLNGTFGSILMTTYSSIDFGEGTTEAGLLGDVDGDGNVDYIQIDDDDDNIIVFRGLGTGLFDTTPISTPFNDNIGTSTSEVTLMADLNNDGLDDIFFADDFGSTNSIKVYLADGAGSFVFPALTTSFPISIDFGEASSEAGLLGDVDGDGNVDYVQIDDVGIGSINVYMGLGTGLFNTTPIASAPIVNIGFDASQTTHMADINDDGFDDILYANTNSNSISVYFSDGTGNFGAAIETLSITSPIGQGANNVDFLYVTNDLDNDGVINRLDLDSDNDGIPDNVEAQATSAYVDPGVFNDVDGDGLNTIYDNSPLTSSGPSRLLIPVDTDSDGILDYLDTDSDNDGITDLEESFATTPTDIVGVNGLFDDAEGPDDYTDVNGNAHDGTNFTSLLDADDDTEPNGSNAELTFINLDYRDSFLTVDTDNDDINDRFDIDDDNDGIIDALEDRVSFVHVNEILGARTYNSNGNGTFNATPVVTPGINFDAIGVNGARNTLMADVNNDGISDIVFALEFNRIDVFLGNANGTFNTAITTTGGDIGDFGEDGNNAGFLGDVNGDGNIDLIFVNQSNGSRVFLGLGDGTFNTTVILTPGSNFLNIGADNNENTLMADVNNDGLSDIVYAQEFNRIDVFLSNGDGTFAPAISTAGGDIGDFGQGTNEAGLIGDVDGDGKIDLVFVHQSDGSRVFLGLGNGAFRTTAILTPGSNFTTIGMVENRNTVMGDVNADGFADIIFALNDTRIDVFLSNGNGTFAAAISTPTGAPSNFGHDNNEAGFIVIDTDFDQDGIANRIDLDSDNDGIPDNIEVQTTQNYIAPGVFADGNTNGLNDAYETAQGGTDLTPIDTDSDRIVDVFDTDSDNDGTTDLEESFATVPSGTVGVNGLFNDAGLNDYTDVNGLAYEDSSGEFTLNKDNVVLDDNGTNAIALVRDFDYRQGPDTDSDGISDTADVDDDNDGILDIDELAPGINYLFFNTPLELFPSAVSDIPTTGEDAFGIATDFNVDAIASTLPGGSGDYSFAFTGLVNLEFLEEYTFFLNSDNSCRVFINGIEVVTDTTPSGEETGTPISLVKGLHNIQILMTDGGGTGRLILEYSSASVPKQDLFPQLYTEPAINVALGGTASQSSTFDASRPASNAIDGNTSSSGNAYALTRNDKTATEWWEVDLGATTSISSINIFNRDDCCQNRLGGVHLLVADTPFPVDASDLAGAIANANYSYQFPPSVTGDGKIKVDPNVTGRYVRLQKSGTNPGGDYLQITEVQVFTIDGDGIPNRLDIDSDNDGITDNVEAQLTSAYTAPSGLGGTMDFIDANNDGLDDNYGSGISPVDTDGDGIPDYLDFNSDNDTEGGDIAERVEAGPTTITDVTDTDGDGLLDIFEGVLGLMPTDDGFDVNDENIDGDDGGADGSFTSFNLLSQNTALAPDYSNAVPLLRDLNFRQDRDTDNDTVSDLFDIDDDNDGVLDIDEDLVNIATYGIATQSSTRSAVVPEPAPGFLRASYAIDGNTASGVDTYVHTNGITSTDWWEVDLGVTTSISSIEIFNRDGGGQSRLGNVYVLIADTPFPTNVNDLAGAIANADFTFQLYSSITGDETVAVPNVMGRYVRLQKSGTNPGGNILNFAEVQVFTDDFDGDGIPNRIDLDSDNDGIPDNIEAQATNAYIPPTDFTDLDGDGLILTYDNNTSISPALSRLITPVDTDSDGDPDFLDTNADNDIIPDLEESFATTPTGPVGVNGLFNSLEMGGVDNNYTDVNGVIHDGTNFIMLLDSDEDTDPDGGNASAAIVDLSNADFNYRDVDYIETFITPHLNRGVGITKEEIILSSIYGDNTTIFITDGGGTPVSITDDDGNLVSSSPYIASKGGPVLVPFNPDSAPSEPLTISRDTDNMGKVTPNVGLRILSTKENFTVYQARSSAQATIYTAKGEAAVGKNFKWAVPSARMTGARNSILSIHAVENTRVEITGIDPATQITNHPAHGGSLTANLAAGESIIYEVAGGNTVANRFGHVGADINATGDIVVLTGGSTINAIAENPDRQDVAYSQLVPENLLGTRYLVIAGKVPVSERVFVTAIRDNTDIFVNGALTPIATINEGEQFIISGSNFVAPDNVYMNIETTQPAYVHHVVLGLNDQANQDITLVAPLSIFSNNFLDELGSVGRISVLNYPGSSLRILTEAGGTLQVKLNNLPITIPAPISAPTPSPLTTDYEFREIALQDIANPMGGNGSTVTISSDLPLQVSSIGTNDVATFVGYYSGFGDLPRIERIECPIVLELIDSPLYQSYQWYKDNVLIPGETALTLNPTTNGIYTVQVFDFNGRSEFSSFIEIDEVDTDLDGVFDVCDMDDDNDGILDTSEGEGDFNPNGDEDGDTILNYLDTTDDGDTGDGSITEYTDDNADGIPNVFDTDEDGIPNHLDTDADDDGCFDALESGHNLPVQADGTITDGSDVEINGMSILVETDDTFDATENYDLFETVFGFPDFLNKDILGINCMINYMRHGKFFQAGEKQPMKFGGN